MQIEKVIFKTYLDKTDDLEIVHDTNLLDLTKH